MTELELIVKNLDKIGTELYNKFGTDSYDIRCELHDIKDQLKAINYTRCCEKLKEEEALNFNSWLLNNGYMPYRDDLFIGKDNQLHFEDKLMKTYNDEVMNF